MEHEHQPQRGDEISALERSWSECAVEADHSTTDRVGTVVGLVSHQQSGDAPAWLPTLESKLASAETRLSGDSGELRIVAHDQVGLEDAVVHVVDCGDDPASATLPDIGADHNGILLVVEPTVGRVVLQELLGDSRVRGALPPRFRCLDLVESLQEIVESGAFAWHRHLRPGLPSPVPPQLINLYSVPELQSMSAFFHPDEGKTSAPEITQLIGRSIEHLSQRIDTSEITSATEPADRIRLQSALRKLGTDLAAEQRNSRTAARS
jgi:hypothetical protein